MKKTTVAVIGCGTIANSAHIPAYMKNPDAEIKYFCDIIPEKAQKCVEKYGCGIAVTDYHDVLADPEVEAVSVCTPNNVHPLIAIDALLAGKHVLAKSRLPAPTLRRWKCRRCSMRLAECLTSVWSTASTLPSMKSKSGFRPASWARSIMFTFLSALTVRFRVWAARLRPRPCWRRRAD